MDLFNPNPSLEKISFTKPSTHKLSKIESNLVGFGKGVDCSQRLVIHSRLFILAARERIFSTILDNISSGVEEFIL